MHEARARAARCTEHWGRRRPSPSASRDNSPKWQSRSFVRELRLVRAKNKKSGVVIPKNIMTACARCVAHAHQTPKPSTHTACISYRSLSLSLSLSISLRLSLRPPRRAELREELRVWGRSCVLEHGIFALGTSAARADSGRGTTPHTLWATRERATRTGIVPRKKVAARALALPLSPWPRTVDGPQKS